MENQKQPVKFSKTEVSEKFEALISDDIMVHKAGVYSGQFSNITLKMAEAMVKQKSNIIAEKQPPAKSGEKNK